jgi:uncharacterized protein YceH (UPF0502 family)
VNASLGLDTRQAAILCELLLRGPQTPGELRNRGSRLAKFETLEDVEAVLQALEEREADALVVQLPRQPGTKERRWAHLLAGELAIEAASAGGGAMMEEEGGSNASVGPQLERLEREMGEQREELGQLRAAFEAYKGQFS